MAYANSYAHPAAAGLAQLPVSQQAAMTQQDQVLANHLFGQVDRVQTSAVVSWVKGPLLAAALVGLMCLPTANEIIIKFYPKAEENPYTLIMIKMVITAVLYYVIYNWALARK